MQMLPAASKGVIGLWMGYITAAWLIGAAVGGLVFGWLGDRIGRVRGMALSVLVYSAFTGVGYFAQQPWHLMVLRFFAALGMGGEWSLGVALVMECWPNNRRPLLAGLIGMSANIGFTITVETTRTDFVVTITEDFMAVGDAWREFRAGRCSTFVDPALTFQNRKDGSTPKPRSRRAANHRSPAAMSYPPLLSRTLIWASCWLIIAR